MHACLKSFSQHIGQYSCRANHKILLDFISGPISYFELFFCCDWKPVFGLLIVHAAQLGCPDKLERKELPRLRVERRLTKTALFQHTCPCLSYYRADQLLVDKTIIWSDLPCLCWGKIVRRVVIITIVTTSLTITIAAESGWVEIWIWLQRISGDNIRAVGNVQLDGFSCWVDKMVRMISARSGVSDSQAGGPLYLRNIFRTIQLEKCFLKLPAIFVQKTLPDRNLKS